MKIFRKLFMLVIAAAFAFALVACGNEDNPTPVNPDPVNPDPVNPDPVNPDPVNPDPVVTPDEGELSGSYTMHDFLSSTTSLKWNPLTWETNDDSSILGYLSMGFYDYRVAVDKDGNSLGKYEVVPEMASALPIDVTKLYVGEYGIEEGDTNKAFRIPLNANAKWNDGTPITADDYIYSMMQQLDPAQKNRRADSYYGGDFSFWNAQNYLYQGKKVEQDAGGSVTLADLTKNADGVYSSEIGPAYIAVAKPLAWLSGNTLKDYVDAYGTKYFGLTYWDQLLAKATDGLVPLTDETYEWIKDVTNANPAWGETEVDVPNYFYVTNQYDIMSFDEVGLKKINDYTIDIIIEGSGLENPTFYLPYHLSSTWLVKKDLYEACWTTAADGTRVNTYGTSVATTASYGPYMMTSYEEDKQIKFARNEEWYGWTDSIHYVNGKRLYQTTNIQIDVISGHETQLLAFKKGKIDGVGLQADDMDEFGNSKYKLLTPQSYTTKLTFNTDKEKLAAREIGVNKTILTNQKFRHAISLCFDRSDFCQQFTAGHTAGFGLYNYMYMFFTSEGLTLSYRETDAAKEALCKVYGVTYGGEEDAFDTLDEAYKAITGYDVTTARAILKEAIKEVKADGTWDGTTPVSLEFAVYQADEIYTNMFNFFNSAVQELAKGTELEGKIELTMKVDDDYYETMYDGNTDIIFSTWGGATYGTIGMMSNVYVDFTGDYDAQFNQMEVGFYASKVMVKFTLNETIGEKTYSLKAWADWLNNKKNGTGEDMSALGATSDVAPEDRIRLVAELEYQYLNQFVNTPIYYRQTVSLHSMKINYVAPDEYIDLVGHGGLSQITYNYDDAEWSVYVKSQGGELRY